MKVRRLIAPVVVIELGDGENLDEKAVSSFKNLGRFLIIKRGEDYRVKNGKSQDWGRERLKIYKGCVRSGQRVEHYGDILILGDVNRDGMVVAGGNVIVMGKLRGIVHAGAFGDESAIVVANLMEPQQIRIGSKIAIGEEDSPGYPELARVEGENIVVEPIK